MFREITDFFNTHIKLICLGLFAFAVLVGKAGFGSFLPQMTGLNILNSLEFRLPIVLFISAALVYMHFSKAHTAYLSLIREQQALLLWIGSVCVYMVGIWLHTTTGSPQSILYLFAYCVLAAFLFRQKKDIIRLCWFVVGYVALIYAIVAIPGLRAGNLEDPILGSSYSISRIGAIGACCAWVIALDSVSRKTRSAMWILSAVLLGLASMSYERAILILFPFALCFGGFFLFVRQTPRIFLKMALCVIVTGIGMTFLTSGTIFQRIDEHKPVVEAVAREDDHINFGCAPNISEFAEAHHMKKGITPSSCNPMLTIRDSDGRLRLYLHALKSDPGMFGHGLGTYLFLDGKDPRSDPQVHTYPHNVFLQIFYEGGYAGFLLLFGATVFVFICIVRHIILSDIVYAPLCVLAVFYFCSSMVSGDIYDSRFLWIIPLIVGKVTLLPLPLGAPILKSRL